MWVSMAHQEQEESSGVGLYALVSLISVPEIHIHVHKLTRGPCRSLLLIGSRKEVVVLAYVPLLP